MSHSLTALVEAGYEAWNAGDRAWVLEHMTADVQWIPPPDDPDASVYVGYEGVERFWADWRAAVGQLRFRPMAIREDGDEVMVTALREGKGAESGLEVSDEVIQVFSFGADGKCFRVREFYDSEQAIAALQSTDQGEWPKPT